MKNVAIWLGKNLAASAAATIGAWGGLILLGQVIVKVNEIKTKRQEKKENNLKEEA